MPRTHALFFFIKPYAEGRVVRVLGVLAVLLGAHFLGGCGSKIGDACVQSTDCATNGSRVCDTSQPNGYCTVLGCVGDSCPNDAACILFQPSVPGCSYDDYQAPARTGRVFCMATCNSDSDCRQSDGYVCADPRMTPWLAVNLDDNQAERVCIIAPPAASADNPDASVCLAGPNMSLADSAVESGGDAHPGASPDAASDGASPDVATDALAAAPPADAPGPD
jgi:hypothetical protein